jgi:predicted nucleic acid-binding protein
MIVVDSSVWIDYFADRRVRHVQVLAALLEQQTALYVVDLIEAEVLRGARDERHAARLAEALEPFQCLDSGGRNRARLTARYYRVLRKLGITPRKSTDIMIATVCIEANFALLHNDRDFDPMVQRLGLRAIDLA